MTDADPAAWNELTEAELAALREAAAELALQNGRGIRRHALVRLAATLRSYAISLYGGSRATDPPVAVVMPLPGRRFAALTPREREVAALVAHGRSNKEIAAELVISLATVKDHVHSILTKSGLRTRAAVAAEWHRS